MSAAATEPAPMVLRQDQDGVAILTLNRAGARNSLSLAMMAALQAALDGVAADGALRCVVLAAEGPAFSAGHDLKELTARRADPDGGQGFFTRAMQDCARLMQSVVALPQPVIAAVTGVATAAGCQLVASCDLAIAGEHARFCTPGVDIGLFCSTPAVALSRSVARKPAMEMLLTGEMIGAEEARRIFLVNRVVPTDQVMPEALELARRIAARSAVAVRMGKRGFNRQLGLDLPRAYEEAAAVMVANLLAEDAAEGIGAFLAKRPPVWTHR